jgi:hypothetical protein
MLKKGKKWKHSNDVQKLHQRVWIARPNSRSICGGKLCFWATEIGPAIGRSTSAHFTRN